MRILEPSQSEQEQQLNDSILTRERGLVSTRYMVDY